MTESFTIDKVGWHTSVRGNPESIEHIIERFWNITNFLQVNDLTKHSLAASIDEINNEFAIHSDDLNEKGLTIVKLGYDKWLSKVDKGMPSNNMEIFIKLLEKYE